MQDSLKPTCASPYHARCSQNGEDAMIIMVPASPQNPLTQSSSPPLTSPSISPAKPTIHPPCHGPCQPHQPQIGTKLASMMAIPRGHTDTRRSTKLPKSQACNRNSNRPLQRQTRTFAWPGLHAARLRANGRWSVPGGDFREKERRPTPPPPPQTKQTADPPPCRKTWCVRPDKLVGGTASQLTRQPADIWRYIGSQLKRVELSPDHCRPFFPTPPAARLLVLVNTPILY